MSSNRQDDETPGRRIESEEMARLHLRLSDEEKAALQKEAERQGVDMSALVRQSIAMYLGWIEGQRQGAAKGKPRSKD